MNKKSTKKIKAFDTELLSTFWWLFKVSIKVAPLQSMGYLVLGTIQIASNLFSYYITARISGMLVTIVAGTRSSSDLWPWFILLLGTSLLAYSAYRIMDLLTQFAYFRLSRWSTTTFFTQLCKMDMSDFYDNDIRNEINRINSGFLWQIPNTATSVISILHSSINTLATVLTIGLVAWWLIPLFVILLLPAFVYESKIAKIGWFIWDEKNDEKHIFYGIQAIFTQAKKQFEIRALTASPRLLSIATKLNDDFYARQENEVKKYNPLAIFAIFLQILREGVAQFWLLTKVISKDLSLEQYFFYVGMIFRLDGAISGLFSAFARMQDGLKYSTDYRKFMSHTPKLVDANDAISLPVDVSPKIEFIDATFTYPGAQKPAFSGLNLVIKSGQKVALVGENGAGKSTIIKLLMRFYRLDSGKLLINGVNILDVEIESWLSRVATLFQDFNEYPLPVSENIAISGNSTNQARVLHASKLAGANTYVEGLPNGYETYLDPAFKNGVEPSGGLWQRIALARAFYREASMIILDEPTSAIDAKAEYEIFNNIFTEHDNKTALIVSHRFSTVRKADRIVVLDGGKIVEDGTHAKLLKKNGLYAEMFNKQAEGYR